MLIKYSLFLILALQEEFQFGIRQEFGNGNVLYVKTIRFVQDAFDCCGYFGFGDWNTSTFQTMSNRTGSLSAPFVYPPSCCDPPNIMNGLFCSARYVRF